MPPEELTELLHENRRLGKPDSMDEIVTSKTWKRGQKVTFTPEELATINKRNEAGGPEEQRFEALALTLTGVENGVALMTMDMTMHVKNPKGTMQMMLSGPVRVEVASGRILEASGKGQVQGDMGGAVTGTVEMKTRYSY